MNLDLFCEEYRKQLPLAVLAHPEEYVWPVSDAPIVAEKMIASFRRGRRGWNYQGQAIKNTCKALGIKHTYKAIEAFWALA